METEITRPYIVDLSNAELDLLMRLARQKMKTPGEMLRFILQEYHDRLYGPNPQYLDDLG